MKDNVKIEGTVHKDFVEGLWDCVLAYLKKADLTILDSLLGVFWFHLTFLRLTNLNPRFVEQHLKKLNDAYKVAWEEKNTQKDKFEELKEKADE